MDTLDISVSPDSGLFLHTPHIPTRLIQAGTLAYVTVHVRICGQPPEGRKTGFANRACALYHKPVMTTIHTDTLASSADPRLFAVFTGDYLQLAYFIDCNNFM